MCSARVSWMRSSIVSRRASWIRTPPLPICCGGQWTTKIPRMKAVLDHVGIAVKDLQSALAFYRDALGLEIEGTEDIASQQVRVHFASVGDPKLEFLEATAPSSPIAKYIEKRGPGLHHITLRVDDVAAALASLKARGVRLIDE